MKKTAIGGALALLYLAVTAVSFRHGLIPVRPLYEGAQPLAPYEWVAPPAGFTEHSPGSGSGVVKFKNGASESGAVSTAEVNNIPAQATLVIVPGSFKPVAGQTSVKVTVKPLDPAKVAAVPSGLSFDSNAYEIAATYQPSGAPAQLTAPAKCPGPTSGLPNNCVSIILRYALNANAIYQLNGGTWQKMANTSVAAGAYQVYADSPSLGTFVAMALPLGKGGRKSGGGTAYLPFALGLAALILGTLAARVRAQRSRRNKKGQKQGPGKGKQSPKAPRARRKPYR